MMMTMMMMMMIDTINTVKAVYQLVYQLLILDIWTKIIKS